MTVEHDLRDRLRTSLGAPDAPATSAPDDWAHIAARGDRRRRRNQAAATTLPILVIVALVAGIGLTRPAGETSVASGGPASTASPAPDQRTGTPQDRVAELRTLLPTPANPATVRFSGWAYTLDRETFQLCLGGIQTSAPPTCEAPFARPVRGQLPTSLAPEHSTPSWWQATDGPVVVVGDYDGDHITLRAIEAGSAANPATERILMPRNLATAPDEQAKARLAAALQDDFRAAGVAEATAEPVPEQPLVSLSLPYTDARIDAWVQAHHPDPNIRVVAPLRGEVPAPTPSGEPPAPPTAADLRSLLPTPSSPARSRARGFAWSHGGGPFKLCGGVMFAMAPPTCDGPVIEGVDPSAFGPLEELVATRWSKPFTVTGSYDGERFVVDGPVEHTDATTPLEPVVTAPIVPPAPGATLPTSSDVCQDLMDEHRTATGRQDNLSCGGFTSTVQISLPFVDRAIVAWWQARYPGVGITADSHIRRLG